jgi:resolvase-like protein
MSGAVATPRRVIGTVRVSERKGREGDSFARPQDQRERMDAACQRDGLKLIQTLEEIDVSGGKSLAGRPQLRQAVEAVEAGKADTVEVLRDLGVADRDAAARWKRGEPVGKVDRRQIVADCVLGRRSNVSIPPGDACDLLVSAERIDLDYDSSLDRAPSRRDASEARLRAMSSAAP